MTRIACADVSFCVTMKLVAHQSREAIPLQRMRADIPKALSEVVARMMAKNPDERYPTPQAVIAALAPWTVKAATRHTVAESATVPQNEWAEFMAAVDAELPKPPKRDRHRSLILGAIAFLPVMLLLGLMVRQMIHVWRA